MIPMAAGTASDSVQLADRIDCFRFLYKTLPFRFLIRAIYQISGFTHERVRDCHLGIQNGELP